MKVMSNTITQQQQLDRAKAIVDRYRQRGNVLPRELSKHKRVEPEKLQEYRDACKLKAWKYSIAGKNRHICTNEVRDYLDEHMPGWRDRVYSHRGQRSTDQMEKDSDVIEEHQEQGYQSPRRMTSTSSTSSVQLARAREIVARCNMRRELLPRVVPSHEQTTPELILENIDAWTLIDWKRSYHADPDTFCPALKHLLDNSLVNWINMKSPVEEKDEMFTSFSYDNCAGTMVTKRQKRDDYGCYSSGTNVEYYDMMTPRTVSSGSTHTDSKQAVDSAFAPYQGKEIMDSNTLSTYHPEYPFGMPLPHLWSHSHASPYSENYLNQHGVMLRLQNVYAYRPSTYGNGSISQRSSLARESYYGSPASFTPIDHSFDAK